MLPSPAWLLTRCRRRAARHGCPFSPRLDDRCACSHRIDRMRATAPKERAGARPTADCSGSTPKPSPIAPRGRINHASNPLERLPGSSAPGVGATDRPQARACQPELASLNRVSLPHSTYSISLQIEPIRYAAEFVHSTRLVADDDARVPECCSYVNSVSIVSATTTVHTLSLFRQLTAS